MATVKQDPQIGTFLVICHTENCENKDIEITVQAYIPATVICGGCSIQITDVTEIAPEISE
jgi:hypothetical protein